MHPEKLRALADSLEVLGQQVTAGHSEGHVLGTYIFSQEEDASRLRKLLDTLGSTEPWASRATRTEVHRLLQEAIHASATSNRAAVEQMLLSSEQALQNSPARTVLLPVQGIHIARGDLELGSVSFFHLSSARISSLAHGYVTGGEALVQAYTRELEHFSNINVSLYHARGSAERVRRDAVLQTRASLQILRALVILSHQAPRQVEIAVSGDERLGAHAGIILEEGGLSASQQPLDDVRVDDLWLHLEALHPYEKLGFDQVRAALRQPHSALNTWQLTLLRAYEWLGNAHQQADPESAFLSLAIVLEVLFTEGQEVSAGIADAVAFLTTRGVDARRERVKQVKALYSLRSRIAHGQAGTPVTWTDVDQLRFLLRDVLRVVRAASASWTKREELNAHLMMLKYG